MKLIDFDELEKLKDTDDSELLEEGWDGNFFAEFADRVSDEIEDDEEYLAMPKEIMNDVQSDNEETDEEERYIIEKEEEDIYAVPEDSEIIPLEEKRRKFGRMLGLRMPEELSLEEVTDQSDTAKYVSEEVVLEEDAEDSFVDENEDVDAFQKEEFLQIDFEAMADQMAEELLEQQTQKSDEPVYYNPLEFGEEASETYEEFRDEYVRRHILKEESDVFYEEESESSDIEEPEVFNEKELETSNEEEPENFDEPEPAVEEFQGEQDVSEIIETNESETEEDNGSSFVDAEEFYRIEQEEEKKVLNIRDLPTSNTTTQNTSEGVLQKRTLPNRLSSENEKQDEAIETEERQEAEEKSSSSRASLGLTPGRKIRKLQSAFEDEYLDIMEYDMFDRKHKKRRRKKSYAKKSFKDNRIDWEEEEETPDKPFKEFMGLMISIAVVVLVTFVLVEFVGQRTEVNGESMESTLHDGDNLIVDKITYAFDEPERFDIVVFPYKMVNATEEVYYIKRIIGLPGERVQITNGFIYINGQLLKESYGKNNNLILNPGRAEKEIQLGEDEYFVLGDNRNNSSDSREIGNIKRDDIIGRAWLRIWPLSDFGILRHQ